MTEGMMQDLLHPLHPQTSMTLHDACLCNFGMLQAACDRQSHPPCITMRIVVSMIKQVLREPPLDHALAYLYERHTGPVPLCFGFRSYHTV